MGHVVALREVEPADLPLFFAHQAEPEAVAMAAFSPRDRQEFDAHWSKLTRDPAVIARTILVGGAVAGYLTCFPSDGEQRVGYWLGRGFWGQGVATAALASFVRRETQRPLHARVARHNIASLRVLAKCGFVVDRNEPPAPDGDGVEELVMVLRGAQA